MDENELRPASPTDQSDQAPSARSPWRRPAVLSAAAVGALVIIVAIGTFVVLDDGLDEHAQKACDKVTELDAPRRDPSSMNSMIDGAVGELVAISEAKKSSVDGLREAAATKDLGSDLPRDSAMYRNPGDVQFNAIAEWCDQNA